MKHTILSGVVAHMEEQAGVIIDATVKDCPMLTAPERHALTLQSVIYWAIAYSNNLMTQVPAARHGALRHALAVVATKKLAEVDREHFKTLEGIAE